jgi:hypothetical protein
LASWLLVMRMFLASHSSLPSYFMAMVPRSIH